MGTGEVHTGFWCGDLKERVHFKYLGVDGRIILNGSSRSEMGSVDWIYLAQDRDRWRAVVNAVMNLRVPQNAGNFLTG
jgi:hypothetical protein